MQARYYDPMIGRFYSNDPVDTLGLLGKGDGPHSFNRYAYVGNNPYAYTDPDGKNRRSRRKEGLAAAALIAKGVQAITEPGSTAHNIAVQTEKAALQGLSGKRTFKSSPKHGNTTKKTAKGDASPGPKDGQAALDNSVQVKSTSTARVGVDNKNKEVVVLKESGKNSNEFHGFVPEKLTQEEANAVRKNFPNVKVKNNGSCTVCDN
jgi:uncharacterized protein RhaS with RHS repeats